MHADNISAVKINSNRYNNKGGKPRITRIANNRNTGTQLLYDCFAVSHIASRRRHTMLPYSSTKTSAESNLSNFFVHPRSHKN